MTDDKQTFADLLADAVRQRMMREATALDNAVAALVLAGAQVDDLVIEYWPQGKGDDPTPFSVVRKRDDR